MVWAAVVYMGSLKPFYRHCTVAGLLEKVDQTNCSENRIPVSKIRGVAVNQCYLSNAKDVIYSVARFCCSPVTDTPPES